MVLYLSQQQYMVNSLNEENLYNLKPASSPMEPKINFSDGDISPLNQEETTRYRRILGSLQYLKTTRPDISFAVSKMSQFFSRPSKSHWQALQRILRYVSQNPYLEILIRPTSSIDIQVYLDTNWAGDTSDRRSQGGFLV